MKLSWIWQRNPLKMSQKIAIAFYFTKEIHIILLVGFKKNWGNTSVKRISFVVAWVGGILSFVHTPVVRNPYTWTTLGLRLRFARIRVNAQFWIFNLLMVFFGFFVRPFFCFDEYFLMLFVFCPLFNCFIFFDAFLGFFCLFLAFISNNLSNNNIFFSILNSIQVHVKFCFEKYNY